MTTNEQHAYEVAYRNVLARRDWVRHHYRGDEGVAYDSGVSDACAVLAAARKS